jgi:hypothetical protein
MQDISIGIPKLKSYFYEHDTKGKRQLFLAFLVLGPSAENFQLTNIYDGEWSVCQFMLSKRSFSEGFLRQCGMIV